MKKFLFASDNTYGVNDEVLQYISKINSGTDEPYGNDAVTKEAKYILEEDLFPGYSAFFVFNGTAANVYGLSAFLESYHSVMTSKVAHIHTTEKSALESLSGVKIELVERTDSKLGIEDIRPFLRRKNSVHYSHPKVVHITQCTEYGLTYTASEIKNIADFCHKNDMYLFVDGARVMNAIVHNVGFDKPLSEYKRELQAEIIDAEVDGFYFGFIKNGGMFGEVVMINQRNPKALEKAFHLQKQYLQLNSKFRFMSASIVALLKDNLYIKNALNSNKTAKMIYDGLLAMGFNFMFEQQSNIILPHFGEYLFEKINNKYSIHHEGFRDGNYFSRIVTSFATTESDVEEFLEFVKSVK